MKIKEEIKLTKKESCWLKTIRFNLLIPFIVFWILCLVLPNMFYLSCKKGQEPISHYIMGLFFFLIFIIDIILFLIHRSDFWSFISAEFFSFIGLFDLYTDSCFIPLAYDGANMIIYVGATSAFVLTSIPKMYLFFTYISKYKRGKLILLEDELYAMTFERGGISNLIQSLRDEHPQGETTMGGKYRTEMYLNLWKFFTEDVLQFVIQYFYLANIEEYCQGEDSPTLIVYISLSVNIIVGLYSVIDSVVLVCSKRRIVKKTLTKSCADLTGIFSSGKDKIFKYLCEELMSNFTLKQLLLGINIA